ncbi:RNA-guided endonuclease InsQ/TnpB family protein [Granulosicoccus antarcticus]|uniref:Transposase n=1 Tax=Granulosicoccus antarcticus IMCC3135 TaxID=1192854 RepID=A0A2Z2P0G5_9GAMM|nr:RNA-guided endonuclease TnpB family protein [Granulosicoccus antarcticus]ASJ76275.1 hypothetical protein IMCC3135_31130 [Granulosicoccus antarcticus IMCC3135]
MERLQAFKFELRPNGEQTRQLWQFAGCSRFVYNKALALQQENHKAELKYISYVQMCKSLTTWRKDRDTLWLQLAPAQTLQQSLKDLDRAYQNFFSKRAAFPSYKKKGRGNSFRFPEPKQFKLDQTNNRIFLPKLGWMRYRNSRNVIGTLRNITVSERGGKWFFSIQTAQQVDTPLHPSTTAIGLDLGIAIFAAQSDGVIHLPKNSFAQLQRQLAHAQRSLARRCKYSRNWKKQKAKIARLYIRITNVRADYLHQKSHLICLGGPAQNHAVVCIEGLKVSNMSRSASGTRQAPGKNVKAKSGLNRAILDQGWGEFRRQLGYKLKWAGGDLIVVPAQYTSQQCSGCGHIAQENRKIQESFCCVSCGHAENADVNAAKNIVAAGHAVMALVRHSGGGDVRPELHEHAVKAAPVKQEPTGRPSVEAIQACA